MKSPSSNLWAMPCRMSWSLAARLIALTNSVSGQRSTWRLDGFQANARWVRCKTFISRRPQGRVEGYLARRQPWSLYERFAAAKSSLFHRDDANQASSKKGTRTKASRGEFTSGRCMSFDELISGGGERGLAHFDRAIAGVADAVDDVGPEFFWIHLHHAEQGRRRDLTETAQRELDDMLRGPLNQAEDRRDCRGPCGCGPVSRPAPGCRARRERISSTIRPD